MDTATIPTPSIMPQATQPPTYGPVGKPNEPSELAPRVNDSPVSEEGKKRRVALGIIIAVILILLAVGITLLKGNRTSFESIAPTPTPTATQSAVTNRLLNPVASQSAFIKFETDLDSLTRGMQNMHIQNQQLLPPRLELPLGF